MVCRRLTIALVLIFAVTVAGCVGNGDISTAIEKWNKVADKTQQIKLLQEHRIETVKADNVIIGSEVAKDEPNFSIILPLLDKRQKLLDDERKLLEEESILISDFAGTMVNLNGDAQKYGVIALSNLRDAQRYGISSVDNFDRGIESLRLNYNTSEEQYYSQYEQYLNASDLDATNSERYTDKANDAIKKLEALQ